MIVLSVDSSSLVTTVALLKDELQLEVAQIDSSSCVCNLSSQ